MSLEKKNLLVPLGNPRPPSPWARFLSAILRPLFIVLGFVLGNLHKLGFGWLDKRMAKRDEQRFAEDIRTHLSFLFTEHRAHIIPNEGVSPLAVYVTLAVEPLRLLLSLSR